MGGHRTLLHVLGADLERGWDDFVMPRAALPQPSKSSTETFLDPTSHGSSAENLVDKGPSQKDGDVSASASAGRSTSEGVEGPLGSIRSGLGTSRSGRDKESSSGAALGAPRGNDRELHSTAQISRTKTEETTPQKAEVTAAPWVQGQILNAVAHSHLHSETESVEAKICVKEELAVKSKRTRQQELKARVSASLHDLPREGHPVWIVVGGEASGGILVRSGVELTSRPFHSRLATGARVEAIEVRRNRLHYRRIHGDGPDYGWVNVELHGKVLMEREEVGEEDEEDDWR